MTEFISFGELLIDMVATARNVTLYDAPAFEPKPGGAPANVAVGLARLGRDIAFVGKVGTDDFGTGLRTLVTAEGVDTTHLLADLRHMTTLALVSLSDSGSPSFAFALGAHAQFTPEELPAAALQAARVFHFSSITLAHQPVYETTHQAIRIAKQGGAIISYDVNWRPMLYPDHVAGRSVIQEPIPQADILKMNESELTFITGEPDHERALLGLESGAKIVVVTMAEKGCLYLHNGQIKHIPTYPVEQVADATGAGDAFMAALLDGLTTHVETGLNLDPVHVQRVIMRACQAGAIATQTRGAIPSLPRREQLVTLE